jgi:hypothetical protein
MRFQGVGGESAALVLAIGFVILGLVAFPLAKFFLFGAGLIGIGVAVLFRFFRKKPLLPTKLF